MKTKRRHELQTNVLADWVGKKIAAVQPYTTWLIGGVIVILAVAVLLSIRDHRQKGEAEQSWDRFNAASTRGTQAVDADPLELTNAMRELKDLARENENTALAAYAEMTLGDLNLRSGQTKFLVNRSAAQGHFKDAVEHYKKAVEQAPSAEMKDRAMYTLAKSYEWQMQLEKAKETYAQVEGAFAVEAETRVRDLERASTHGFYERYANWKPKPKPAVSDTQPKFDIDSDPSPGDGEMDYDRFLDDTIEGVDLEDSATPPNGDAGAAGDETTATTTDTEVPDTSDSDTIAPDNDQSGDEAPDGRANGATNATATGQPEPAAE